MMKRFLPVSVLVAILMLLPTVAFAAGGGSGDSSGELTGFTLVAFSVLSFGVLGIMAFYTLRDHGK
ncbi:hypothetical protein FLK61_31925 [Paenalkalicoccus suaedae]|uniref:Uncharacterized protein n=1 Tax=Paenalkalicoccus suaedae TaxID=2592382 RepID=A0A859FDN8_9BACI|nr:hypothetical protein [Paenalkalicoccus suaedae]QKS71319.1 hypothetical protein FLK61_31925 [Paenalkalicoccus suaedae]